MKRPGQLSLAAGLCVPLAFAALGLTIASFPLALPALQALSEKAESGSSVAAGAPYLLGLLVFAPALWLVRAASKARKGVPGRTRSYLLGALLVIFTVAAGATAGTFGAGLAHLLSEGGTLLYGPSDAFLTAPPALRVAAMAFGGTAAFCAAGATVLALAHWPLLPRTLRMVVFALIDLGLFAGAVWATLHLSDAPVADAPLPQAEPATRLGLQVACGARILVRLLPLALHYLERLNVRTLVGARHLRSKKSGFLTAIGGLTMIATAVATGMLTSVLSVMGGFHEDMRAKILGHHAHVVVEGPRDTFEGIDPILERLEAVPGVTAAAPFLSGEVMVTSTSNFAGAVLRGVEPERLAAVTDLGSKLVRGRIEYLADPAALLHLSAEERGSILAPAAQVNDPEHRDEVLRNEALSAFMREDRQPERDVLPGVIIGSELANQLHARVGDDIDVVHPFGELGPTGMMPRSRRFRVAGVFHTGMYQYDATHIYMTLGEAQRFLAAGERVSGVELRVADVDGAAEVAAAAQAAVGLEGFRADSWQVRNRHLFGALNLEKILMFFVLCIAVGIAGLCVFATVALLVQEKRREIGILKAMGATDATIQAIFLFEGTLIGIIGAAAGLGIGFVLAFAAEHFAIRLNPEVFNLDRLPVRTDLTEFAVVGVAAVVVCVVTTLIPARVASRAQPVDALRHG